MSFRALKKIVTNRKRPHRPELAERGWPAWIPGRRGPGRRRPPHQVLMPASPLVAIVLAVCLAGCGDRSPAAKQPAAQADRSSQAAPGRTLPEKHSRPAPMSVTSQASDTAEDEPVAAVAAASAPSEPRQPAESAGSSASPADSARVWRDPAGNVLAVGELVDLLDEKVCIQQPDGLGAVVPLDRLCQADRQYVLAQSGDRPTGPDETTETQTAGTEGTPTAGHPPQAAETPRPAGSAGRRKVVIPFDFQSKFDDGRYGRQVGEMIWKKLEREGGFLIPESMFDVRDLLAARRIQIGPDTPLEEVKRVVRDLFDAQIGIWGSVERVPGHEWDVYDLVIRCVDFSSEPEPKVIYEKTGIRTRSVSEIPHLYVKEMLDALYGRRPGEPPPIDQLAEANWKNNPNLIVGGDFEKGAGGVPLGWESRGGQQRQPLGGLVQWTTEGGDPKNKVIRFQFSKAVGDTTGVMYYSDWFPVQQGARYRFQCRWRTDGPSPKVFIKCYAEMPSDYQPGAGYRPSPGEYLPESLQRREVYRSQQNLKGPKNTWNVHTEDFTPRHTKYEPKWGRVMLYAYLGGGVVEWDDVVVKQIVPASPGEGRQRPRHSMASDVTIDQMRANEERGRRARERLREGRD